MNAEVKIYSDSTFPWLRALLEFSRPHTIIGTTLAVAVFYVLAYAASGAPHRLDVLLMAYIASLAVNIYIVGLNQLTDIEIDKINKPYLPLAAGIFSWNVGLALVIGTGIIALGVAILQGPYLFATIATVFLIGTAYSLPPLRLKRFPFWAALSITLARAVVGNIGAYLTYSNAFTGKAELPANILLFVTFMFGFCLVIAIMKDVPDIEGDRKHQISTLVVRLGAAKTMQLCRWILTGFYLIMILAPFAGIAGIHPGVFSAAHAIALLMLWYNGRNTDDTSKQDVFGYYMFIWKLFYFEFILFPAACLLS